MSDNMNKKPPQGRFCWNELMTNDSDKAREFYGELLGWKSEEVPVGDKSYFMLKQGEEGVGGMMQIPKDKKEWANIPSHWISYISVDNLDITLIKAQKLSAKIVVPATNVGDHGRFAIIQDPTGAQVAFWQSLQKA
jgi:predicted enzyme related to lactoylglutathione lyase